MCIASPVFRGTKLTRPSHYLDVVFLLCFLPEFRGKGNRKTVGGRWGTKTSLFLPPRAGTRDSVASSVSAGHPAGKGVYGRDTREPLGQGPHRCAGAVPLHSSLPGRRRAAAHTGSTAWPVSPHRATLGPAVS